MIFLIVSIIAGAMIGVQYAMMDGDGIITGVVGGIIGVMALLVRKTESITKHAIVWVVIGSIIGATVGSLFHLWGPVFGIGTILGAIFGGILGALVTRAKFKATIKDYMISGAIITFVVGGFIGHMINGDFFSIILYGILGGGIGCGIAAIAYAKTRRRVVNNEVAEQPSAQICFRCPYLVKKDWMNNYCSKRDENMSEEYVHRDTYCTGVNMKIPGNNPWTHCPYY